MDAVRSWWGVLGTVLAEVALPVGAYALLRSAEAPEGGSLVGAGAVSVITGSVQWVSKRNVGLLGLVVLVGFVGGAAIAFVTDSPVAVFMVDPVGNLVVVAMVLVMMATPRPFVAYIRRDLSPRPVAFDQRWEADSGFRCAHRTASWIWAVGLTLLAAVWTGCVLWLPFDVAVVASRVVGAVGFVGMIASSEVVVRRAEVAA